MLVALLEVRYPETLGEDSVANELLVDSKTPFAEITEEEYQILWRYIRRNQKSWVLVTQRNDCIPETLEKAVAMAKADQEEYEKAEQKRLEARKKYEEKKALKQQEKKIKLLEKLKKELGESSVGQTSCAR